jgi:hypothetical protein
VSAPARERQPEPVGQFAIWFGFLGGVLAWIAHLFVAYAAVPLACETGLEIVLYATVVVTVLVALAATLVAWRGWSRTREDPNGDIIMQRTKFLTLSGLLMSGLFLLVIIAQSSPIFLNGPCDPAGSVRI